MSVWAGADAGGTGTRAAIGDGQAVRSVAQGPGGAVRPGRVLAAASAIAGVVRQALMAAGAAEADALVVGAAGAGREPERGELEQALRGEHIARRVRVTTDVALALEAAFGEGPGIVVSAGTGSIAVARLPTGETRRTGGYGWQMGDEGSGYAIGRAALAAVSRALDGRGAPTPLLDLVLQRARCRDAEGLVRWAGTAGPSEVAGLAPVVFRAADQGDPTAQGIADFAARELAQLVAALRQHFPEEPPVPVALAGGLLASGGALRERLVSRIEGAGIRIAPEAPDPLLGALALAARLG
ncbi:MAG TPA: BadF/BadG/BcrA/BcrD ATPase family protein [Gemmatimonadales bacterium]|nr:BadF/BadG/BcrA/BcrD ATPase family protein [Gemmatimonadales bacterium]